MIEEKTTMYDKSGSLRLDRLMVCTFAAMSPSPGGALQRSGSGQSHVLRIVYEGTKLHA